MITYYDVVNQIKLYVEQHPQLAQFGYGYISDIRTNQTATEVAGQYITNAVDYPYVYVVPNTHKILPNQKTYSFNLIVMDQLAIKETQIDGMINYLRVQSDCELYASDLLARLYFETGSNYDVSNVGQITTFKERFDDWVAGVTLTIEITIPGGLNACDIPY